MKIKNYDALTAVGDISSRELVLGIANEALQQVDSYRRIRDLMRIDGDVLHVGARSWDLGQKRNVYLIGAGKACNSMAMAVDHALGDRLTRGIAIVKIAEPDDHYHRTEVYVGGHPLPDAAGHRATLRILAMIDSAGPEDLFIAVVSGGSSALLNAPIAPITVEDEAVATEVLLTSGLGIYEVNAVRRHISRTNGGRLAQRIAAQGAELITIGISDAVGKPPTADVTQPDPAYSSTPFGPDATTLDDARAAIDGHGLRSRLPETVTRFLDEAGASDETPKAFPDNTYFLINTLPDLAEAALDAARSRGIDAHLLTTYLEGESRDAGTFMASLAHEIQATGRPFVAPCIVVSAGETTTHIRPATTITGHGGPSQELTVGFALASAGIPGACMYSMDSEGTDGTSPAAGGITDSTSLRRAIEAGVDLREHLRGHASFEALSAIDDVVLSGNTGTNLCDLNILFVPDRQQQIAVQENA
ncbi:glycerate 2-kinase [Plantibacter sp. VKM Ac-1784]|uniref:Glycerate 2-kinase n=1 Tax=Plantibacter elymi (nom. nud.) TaxID=199708 RepID=A0ABY1RGA6_9MICO|nr:DUF4147 domain-containing protein [Plantibacter sp. VKM Ac-1784]SMQ71136.1 glycerate 2-kinase [Plantibacter sp. VKM Ac-1784]